MGTWGVKIFDNDIALDVKGDYTEKLIMGASDDEAEDAILKMYYEDLDPVWIPLAIEQWKKGRLSERVKINALLQIEEDMKTLEEVWAKNGMASKRRIELDKARKTLCSDMPARKKVRMPSWALKSPFLPGNVVQFKMIYLKGDLEKWLGKYALLEVVGKTQTPPDKIPVDLIALRPYKWYSDDPVNDIASIFEQNLETVDFYVGNGIFVEEKSFMPIKHLVEQFEMKCVSKTPLNNGEIQNRKVIAVSSNSTISKDIAQTLNHHFKI